VKLTRPCISPIVCTVFLEIRLSCFEFQDANYKKNIMPKMFNKVFDDLEIFSFFFFIK